MCLPQHFRSPAIKNVTLNFCPLRMTLPRAVMGSGHLDWLTTQVSSSVHSEDMLLCSSLPGLILSFDLRH